jgi:hypothetical protein
MGLLPAAGTIVAMTVGFSLVGGFLLAWETVIVGSFWTQILALSIMYIIPHFVVGLWLGTRYGLAVVPPIAAGLTPVIVLMIAMALFGGPIGAPFVNPGLTALSVAVWMAVCAGGLVVGAKTDVAQLKTRPGQ